MLALAMLLLVPNFLQIHLLQVPANGYSWEAYNPRLANEIRSVAELDAAIDTLVKRKGVAVDSPEYGNIASAVVSQRFYHGYSQYALHENWIAALAGKFIWPDLSAIVLPDDVLRYPMAACSQQSIVMMELFRRNKINYRMVGFDHHFALEGKFSYKWYYFDTDKEPDFTKVPLQDFASLQKKQLLENIYKASLDTTGLRQTMGHPFYGKENAAPAPNAALFHTVTRVLSRTLWLLPLSVLLFLWIRQKSSMRRSGIGGRKKALWPVFNLQKKY